MEAPAGPVVAGQGLVFARLTMFVLLVASCVDANSETLREGCDNNRLAPQEQVDRCTEYLATNPAMEERAEALQSRGYVYYRELERLDLALTDYNVAVGLDGQLDPNRTHRASLYFNRGRIHAGLRNEQEAIADFTMAASINPRWSDPISWRSASYERLGDFESAWRDMNQAIEMYPRLAGRDPGPGLREMLVDRCGYETMTGRAHAEPQWCNAAPN
jgi:tetratricopeptide (TPR) repeat protein